MMRLLQGLSACVALCSWAAPAAAHPLLDEARTLANGAEFEQALAVLERAEAGDDMTPDEALELLRQRAIAEFALSASRALDRDLARLAALGWRPPPGDVALPPELVERFTEVARNATPLALSVEVESIAGGVEMRAALDGDVDGTVRAVRFHTRLAGGSWLTSEGLEARAVAPADATVEYHVEVIGPGGAVILREGTESAPLSARPRSVAPIAPSEPERASVTPSDRDSGGLSAGAWVAIIGGALAVIAGVIVAVILVSANALTDALSPPMGPW